MVDQPGVVRNAKTTGKLKACAWIVEERLSVTPLVLVLAKAGFIARIVEALLSVAMIVPM